VYKSIVRRKGDYSIKLKADLRVKGKDIIGKFVNYDMDDKCVCPNVQEGPGKVYFSFYYLTPALTFTCVCHP
jgi:hypothetical protein